MIEGAFIALPMLIGASEVAPREAAPQWSLLLATLGATCGALGIYSALRGRHQQALILDTLSVIFDLWSIKKALVG